MLVLDTMQRTSRFKDNNIHKFPTHQPPLKTPSRASFPEQLPFRHIFALFLQLLFSPVVSAERSEPPSSSLFSPPRSDSSSLLERRQNASRDSAPVPCIQSKEKKRRKKKKKSRIRRRYSGARHGRVFKTVSRDLAVTATSTIPRRFPLTETLAASV